MANRITDEIAAIAVASGYDGPAPKSKVEALNALALALGYDGAYQKRTADAINAVGTVAGGGGGGGDLGAGVTLECTYQNNDHLGFMIMGDGASLMVTSHPDMPAMVPSGLTYLLGGFTNGDTPVTITSAADVTATKVVGEHSPTTFTEFTVVEAMGINAIRIETSAADEDYTLTFDIDTR